MHFLEVTITAVAGAQISNANMVQINTKSKQSETMLTLQCPCQGDASEVRITKDNVPASMEILSLMYHTRPLQSQSQQSQNPRVNMFFDRCR